jgi:hypothetical protein
MFSFHGPCVCAATHVQQMTPCVKESGTVLATLTTGESFIVTTVGDPLTAPCPAPHPLPPPPHLAYCIRACLSPWQRCNGQLYFPCAVHHFLYLLRLNSSLHSACISCMRSLGDSAHPSVLLSHTCDDPSLSNTLVRSRTLLPSLPRPSATRWTCGSAARVGRTLWPPWCAGVLFQSRSTVSTCAIDLRVIVFCARVFGGDCVSAVVCMWTVVCVRVFVRW